MLCISYRSDAPQLVACYLLSAPNVGPIGRQKAGQSYTGRKTYRVVRSVFFVSTLIACATSIT
jgi:hypothetical protein